MDEELTEVIQLRPKLSRTKFALPSATFSSVLHRGQFHQAVGRVAASDRPTGCMLSCAPNAEADEAWTTLAQLGGRPLWRLTSPHGNFFVLVDWLTINKVDRWFLMDLALAYGIIEPTTGFRCSWYDREIRDTRFLICAKESDADAKADDLFGKVERVPAWAALPPLIEFWNSRHGGSSIDYTNVEEAALCMVIERDFPGCDGVFWRSRVDLPSRSAPRVALFPRAFSTKPRFCQQVSCVQSPM